MMKTKIRHMILAAARDAHRCGDLPSDSFPPIEVDGAQVVPRLAVARIELDRPEAMYPPLGER